MAIASARQANRQADWQASQPASQEPAADFRRRLLEGMAAAVRERGFRDATVADVVRHARHKGPRAQGEHGTESARGPIVGPFPPDDPSDVRFRTPRHDDDREQRVRLDHEALDHALSASKDRMVLLPSLS